MGTYSNQFARVLYFSSGSWEELTLDLPDERPLGYLWFDPDTWPVSDSFFLTPLGGEGDDFVSSVTRLWPPFLYSPAEAAAGIGPHLVPVTSE